MAIKLIVALFFPLSIGVLASTEPHVINTTEAFFIAIDRQTFGKKFPANADIELIATISGMPDLPNWMYYRYRNNSQNAYLYGSPQEDGDFDLEIVALDRYTYDTFVDGLSFRVIERENVARYEVEMKFINYNVEDIFESNKLHELRQIFAERLWRSDVYLTAIAAPQDVGGRNPLNPKDKEGVVVRIGSIDNFSRDILDLEREVEVIKNRNPCPRKYKATSAEYLFRNKDLQSDWCNFHLIRTLETNSDRKNTKTGNEDVATPPSLDLESKYQRRSKPYPARDYFPDIVHCLILPSAIGVTVISFLSCLFFHKENIDKDMRETPPADLEKYNTIQRATLQQRQRSIPVPAYGPTHVATLPKVTPII